MKSEDEERIKDLASMQQIPTEVIHATKEEGKTEGSFTENRVGLVIVGEIAATKPLDRIGSSLNSTLPSIVSKLTHPKGKVSYMSSGVGKFIRVDQDFSVDYYGDKGAVEKLEKERNKIKSIINEEVPDSDNIALNPD